MKNKNIKKNQKIIVRILISLVFATILLYALIGTAKLFGANYNITHGEHFITWALLSILSLLSINHFYRK